MTEVQAAERADKIIVLLLTHQPNVLGASALNGEPQARKAANDLATFRKNLIEQLKSQTL